MIASALRDGIRWQTPEQAVAASLDGAHDRLKVGEPAQHMDGRRGIVRAIWAESLDVIVLIEWPDGTRTPERAGFWEGRATL